MTGHDHHFLSRLDRVSDEHVELALTLYRDPLLVSVVLSACHFEETSERVAFALGPRDVGPYVVVARDGGFVTCLGEGMSAEPWPIVSRGKLDSVARNFPQVHQKLEFAKRMGGSKKGLGWELRDRLLKSGPDFCLEDFQTALALQPILSVDYFAWMTHAVEMATRLREQLAGVRKASRSLEEPLHRFFELAYAASNLAMLVAWDATHVQRIIPPECEWNLSIIAWGPTRQGFGGPMFRSLWAAARLGKTILPDLKKRLGQRMSDLLMWTNYGSLAAVGLRHRKLRSEVLGALSPVLEDTDSSNPERTYLAALSKMMVTVFKDQVKDVDTAVRDARSLAQSIVYEHLIHKNVNEFASPDDVPLVIAAQTIRWDVSPLVRVAPDAQFLLLSLIPWAVTMDVEDFFLPRSVVRERRFPWRPEHSLDVLAAHRKYAPRIPVRAERIGPNGPCSCGSGKKYKKCCGRLGAPST